MLALWLTLAAFATAALSSMTGLGGGTILMAVFLTAGMTPVVAIPLHAAVQLVSNSSRVLAYMRHVRWRAAGRYLLGAIPAVFAAAPLVAYVNADWIRLLMAVFIVLTLWRGWTRVLHLQRRHALTTAGVLSGGVGSFVGATGPLSAPFFLRPGWPRTRVIGTLAMCTALTHGLKVVAFASYGYPVTTHWRLLLAMAAATVAGTLLGRRLGSQFSERVFRGVFRFILLALAVKLGYSGIDGLLGS